ncbi:MAG TPA: PHP domain-containing protein [Bacillota bacterium]|nr:PHP domain-containing protein [Bacillota bacterium]HOH10272.1 PHP domain-containing protein [Bacillota bacterium]HOY89741.1 PHP domain-containing protein [Bacillota bacterium]HPI02070.1 PHP domain-containing protein [Bacillota bacterium]HPM64135.1 PHP domain-containing protein [Bacillota bacterium]
MKQSKSLSLGYADLHTHSFHSDGRDAPAQIVQRAKDSGLAGLALTDHDTYEGIEEAGSKAEQLGLRFIPGVELSTVCEEREVHVLGYFPDGPSREFLEMIERMSVKRVGRMKRMIEKLNQLGCPIEEQEVFSRTEGEIVGRAHLFRAIRDTFSGEFDERADKWLNIGGEAFEPTSDMTPSEAIEWIRNSGGAAVLAHPGTSGIDHLIQGLIEHGLMGIEAVYPKHGSMQVRRYKKLAVDNGLIITGGSDWHGIFPGSSVFHSGSLGAGKVPVETIDMLIDAVKDLRNKKEGL